MIPFFIGINLIGMETLLALTKRNSICTHTYTHLPVHTAFGAPVFDTYYNQKLTRPCPLFCFVLCERVIIKAVEHHKHGKTGTVYHVAVRGATRQTKKHIVFYMIYFQHTHTYTYTNKTTTTN